MQQARHNHPRAVFSLAQLPGGVGLSPFHSDSMVLPDGFYFEVKIKCDNQVETGVVSSCSLWKQLDKQKNEKNQIKNGTIIRVVPLDQ